MSRRFGDLLENKGRGRDFNWFVIDTLHQIITGFEPYLFNQLWPPGTLRACKNLKIHKTCVMARSSVLLLLLHCNCWQLITVKMTARNCSLNTENVDAAAAVRKNTI